MKKSLHANYVKLIKLQDVNIQIQLVKGFFLILFNLTGEKILNSNQLILTTSWSKHIKTTSRQVYKPTKLAKKRYNRTATEKSVYRLWQ